jgi:hypothetical protein
MARAIIVKEGHVRVGDVPHPRGFAAKVAAVALM